MSKRPTSPRQRQANIANAKLSTGPRTPEGKLISAQNGCKFKTASIDRLIAGTLFKGEDESGLRVLIEQFTAEFRPQTLNEFGIVEEMASVRWEIGRLLVAKRDIVARLSIDQEGPTEAAKVSKALEAAYSSKGFTNLDRAIHRMRRDFSNLQHDLATALNLRIDRAVNTASHPDAPDPLHHLEIPAEKFHKPKPTDEIFMENPAPQSNAPTPQIPITDPHSRVSQIAGPTPTNPDASDQESGPKLPIAA